MKGYLKFWKLGRPEFNTDLFSVNPNGELVVRQDKAQWVRTQSQ